MPPSASGPATDDGELDRPGPKRHPNGLGEEVLVRNAIWFTQLRWAVVAVFAAFECLGLLAGEHFMKHGVAVPRHWPWVLGAVLCVANAVFSLHARRLRRASAPEGEGRANLWAQIVFDLLVLTVVVHFVGSVGTHICFAYLFHIVLACIFFPPSESFAVTLLASCLYVACVALERCGVVSPSGIFVAAGHPGRSSHSMFWTSTQVGSAAMVFLVVWYLTSHLSELVRVQAAKLRLTNERLVRAAKEKTEHMLYTTHELKAPFAAIQSNVQVLLEGYCGEITPEVRGVLDRIEVRCRKLSNQVIEMLQLANLRSRDAREMPYREADLADLLRRAARSAEASAESRQITFEQELKPVTVRGVPDQLEILLGNIVSNAVAYSRDGGLVTLKCGSNGDGRSVATVEDRGIGIRPDSLPRIFDEYFRSTEGAQHNRMSTGLGLAIVKHVAESHGIGVGVDSELDQGTRFTLTFPA